MPRTSTSFQTAVIAAVVAAAQAAAAAQGAESILHVDAAAPMGGDGQSWTTAHRFLQDALAAAALAAAAPGSGVVEVRVAGGTYRPDESTAAPDGTGARGDSFALIPGVAIRGGYAGVSGPNPDARDFDAHPTVLSGDLLENDQPQWVGHDENSLHIVEATGVGPDAVLDGCTVRGGYAPSSSGFDGAGAGILILSASPTIAQCRIEACLAAVGAGMYCGQGSPIIDGCTFAGNLVWGSRGGGIYFAGPSAATIAGCTFSSNQAFGAGGVGDGGAVFLGFSCPVAFDHCVFIGNLASTSGSVYPTGGAITSLADSVTFNGCRFLHNTTPGGAGGGIWSGGDDVVFSSCEFAGNSATVGGAAALFLSSMARFVNCTVVANSAGDGGGLSLTYSTSAEISNCIFWDNAANAPTPYKAAIHKDDSSEAAVSWTCIEAMWIPEPGEDPLDPENFPGCTDADPMFVDADGPDNVSGTLDDDLGLSAGSPLIDAADSTAVPSWTTTDVAGGPRLIDDPDTADTGVGTAPIVDMGGHEFGEPPLLGDIDGDGAVDGADLGLLLGLWGSAGSVADINEDGTVDGADLGLLLGAWS